MPLNWREIDRIIAETDVAGSRIQRVVQPEFSSLLLELYSPKTSCVLHIDCSQQFSHFCLLPGRLNGKKREIKLQRFAQMLRSRLIGGKIVKFEQIGRERIVKLAIRRQGEDSFLWLRFWSGSFLNIIYTDRHFRIFDLLYRRPNLQEISGEIFKLPEIQSTPNDKNFQPRLFPGSESGYGVALAFHYQNLKTAFYIEKTRRKALKLLTTQQNRLSQKLLYNGESKGFVDDYSGKKIKQQADLLAANRHLIKIGAPSVIVEDYFNDNQPVKIKLAPELSPNDNIQLYYKKYKKKENEIRLQRQQRDNIDQQLANIAALITTATESNEIEELNEISAGFAGKKSTVKEAEKQTPGLQFYSRGFSILVGRNSRENDQLLRHFVRGNDIWLHIRDYPGGYVFIKYQKGKSVPLQTLLDAANLALLYSKNSKAAAADLYYTQVKYLRRAKHGAPGSVIPTQEKNLAVKFEQQRIDRLHSQAKK